MQTEKLFKAKRILQQRIECLENDAKRSFYPINGLHSSPIPILMHAFATLDYISSFWVGWYDRSHKPSNDPRSQIRRMSDFLETYLLYPQKISQVAITIWRHKLIHTSKSKKLVDGSTAYTWEISEKTEHHWTLDNLSTETSIFTLYIGVWNFIDDIKNGIFAPSGFMEDLRIDRRIQLNWQNCEQEMLNHYFKFEN